jgi:tetratricopeptide (TPR) repeat protein
MESSISAATSLLGELMVDERRFDRAIKMFDEARALADDANVIQYQMETRQQLARACLLSGDLSRARVLVEEATKYRVPRAYASVLALQGVVALRQGDSARACRAFDMALNESAVRLARTPRDVSAAFTRALALAGLALCRDAELAADAAEAYRTARRTAGAAPGIVKRELSELDALAAADRAGTLKPVRAALEAGS